MTTANPIVLSGSRLQQETVAFIQETGKAAETLGKGVEKATTAYVGRLKTSGERFVGTTRGAAEALGGAFQKEADYWRDLVLKTRAAYVASLQQRFGKLESDVSGAREALQPNAVRVRVLKTAQGWLDSAQSVVGEQLAEADAPTKPAPKAPPKRAPTRSRRR